jgi:hypothetical protein
VLDLTVGGCAVVLLEVVLYKSPISRVLSSCPQVMYMVDNCVCVGGGGGGGVPASQLCTVVDIYGWECVPGG